MKKFIKKHSPKTLQHWILLVVGIFIFFFGISIIWVSTLELPDFKSFTERKIQSSTKIYDRTGQILLYDVHQDIKRTVIPYEDMGTTIKNATVAIEDSEFYQHKGIRISSIIRGTIWAKLTGRKVQGGSTITQQLIKNTLLTSKVSLTRKIKEWILAIKLERVMSKEEILSLYLNEVPYGGNIYGIYEASLAFFGKKPIDLTLAESAYLAAIPNGPTYYSPYRKNRDKLEDRKNLVLKRMRDVKFITEEEYQAGIKETVTFLPEQPARISAPHFVFFVKDYIENTYGQDTLDTGGLKIITTLDYELQKIAEDIAKQKGKENERDWNGKNVAIVVIDPKNGHILSMVGSRDYFDKTVDGNFNVATAARQPGSSFKPIVYANAFEKGYTASTVLFDVKTEFNASCSPTSQPPQGSSTKCYSPDNYDNAFRGPMSLKDGLAQSINVIAVKLLYLVGVPDAIKMARDLGITTLNDPERYGLSLVIGGGETTLLDMTSAYGVFANAGVRHPYQAILSVEDSSGNKLEEYKEKSYQALSANSTRILSEILSDNTARTPTFGANSPLVVPGHTVAVKTGTTNDNKDAWTIGYTPSISVGVWVGNNDNIPMKKGGAALAGPIWNRVITEALKKTPVENFTEPDPIDPTIPPILRGFWQGGETVITDTISGKLATEYTPLPLRKETSITSVHTILHWINKDEPLGPRPINPTKDSQYKNWEYGVSNWWANNKYKFKIITRDSFPTDYETIHTSDSKPVIHIAGFEDRIYTINETITVSLNVTTISPIKKIDVFINNTYLTSLKSYPYTLSFSPNMISDIRNKNTIHIIGYDAMGNVGEITDTFLVEKTNEYQ